MAAKAEELTADRLRSLLTYEPETGLFRWRERRGSAAAGKVAGCFTKADGYIRLRLNDTLYLAHRLAWFYVHGEWPTDQLDHINGSRSDNRLGNLRACTQTENGWNRRSPRQSKSGRRGVVWDRLGHKWAARIMAHGKHHWLGLFEDLDEAAAAYDRAALSLHGDFATINGVA